MVVTAYIATEDALFSRICQMASTGAPSQLLVSCCGMIFHLNYGGRDGPSTISDDLWKLIFLATDAPSESFELSALSVYNMVSLQWHFRFQKFFSRTAVPELVKVKDQGPFTLEIYFKILFWNKNFEIFLLKVSTFTLEINFRKPTSSTLYSLFVDTGQLTNHSTP